MTDAAFEVELDGDELEILIDLLDYRLVWLDEVIDPPQSLQVERRQVLALYGRLTEILGT